MKRRHYRIHYNDKKRPMHRVKHREIPWGSVLLAVLALLLIAAVVFAVSRWFDLGGTGNPISKVLGS